MNSFVKLIANVDMSKIAEQLRKKSYSLSVVTCECGGDTYTKDSRKVVLEDVGLTQRKQRVCKECGNKWTTYEIRMKT